MTSTQPGKTLNHPGNPDAGPARNIRSGAAPGPSQQSVKRRLPARAGPAVVRTAATRVAPDPVRLAEFAEVIRHASDPVLIYGAAIARGSGWDQAVALAEALNAPVWAAPSSERAPFPRTI